MKCLILGGGGFLGSHLCDALLTYGHTIRIFDRPNLKRFRKFSGDEPVEWFEGDFVNSEDLVRSVSGCDIIYHLVSTTLPKTSNDNPIYDIETNVIGTLRLLEKAKEERVKKVVFVSSGGTIYGIPDEVPIKENHPTEPICSYGIGKLAIEKYLNLYNELYDVDYCVLRLSNPYGNRQNINGSQGAVSVFLNKAMRNEIIEIWGDGSVVRDYIHVNDVVRAMVMILDLNQGDKKIFNIGSGYGKSLNEIVSEINKIIPTMRAPEYSSSRALDVPTNILDISLAKEIFGWVPEVTFEEGLKMTFNWMLSRNVIFNK